jgi:hypothetical protein
MWLGENRSVARFAETLKSQQLKRFIPGDQKLHIKHHPWKPKVKNLDELHGNDRSLSSYLAPHSQACIQLTPPPVYWKQSYYNVV